MKTQEVATTDLKFCLLVCNKDVVLWKQPPSSLEEAVWRGSWLPSSLLGHWPHVIGLQGRAASPREAKLWVHKALGAERRKDERGKEGGRTATWEHPFIIRAISLLIKWPCVNSSTPHSSRVIRRGTLADRSRPHGLLNQGELPPPKELYVTQPSPRLTERHWGGGGGCLSLSPLRAE